MLNITSLQTALKSMESAIGIYSVLVGASSRQEERAVVGAGVIQNFEVTYELCWKFMKRWINLNADPTAADGVTRRELFRLAAQNRLIDDVDKWMEFHAARNQTSHSYNQDVAEEVLAVALESLPTMQDFQKSLERRL